MQKSRLRTAYVFVQHLIEAIEEGAVLRVRPKAMTVTVIVGGLLQSEGAARDGVRQGGLSSTLSNALNLPQHL
jgi:hypothetical protein